MNDQLYECNEVSRYSYQLAEVRNIEDASDIVYTVEELKEMFGPDSWASSGTHFNYRAIREALEALRDEAKSKNKISALIKDEDLLEAVQRVGVGQHIPHARRVGNRIFFRDAPPNNTEKIGIKHFRLLVNTAVYVINHNQRYVFDLTYTAHDRQGSLQLLKKLVSWDDLEQAMDNVFKTPTETKAFCKQLWDDPTLF